MLNTLIFFPNYSSSIQVLLSYLKSQEIKPPLYVTKHHWIDWTKKDFKYLYIQDPMAASTYLECKGRSRITSLNSNELDNEIVVNMISQSTVLEESKSSI